MALAYYVYKVNAISCMHYLPICEMIWWLIIYCISPTLAIGYFSKIGYFLKIGYFSNMVYFSKIGYFSNIAYFSNLYLSRLLENLPRPTIKHLHQVFSSRVSTTVKLMVWEYLARDFHAILTLMHAISRPECVIARVILLHERVTCNKK